MVKDSGHSDSLIQDLQTLNLTDEHIQALVDGELSDMEEERIKRFFVFYPSLERRYNELREQKELLQHWASMLKNAH